MPDFEAELRRWLADMSDAVWQRVDTARFGELTVVYLQSITDGKHLENVVIRPLKHGDVGSVRQAVAALEARDCPQPQEAAELICRGWAAVLSPEGCLVVNAAESFGRAIEISEQEMVMYGPKDSFTERLDQNLTLLRRRLPIPRFKSVIYTLGSLGRTHVTLLYLEGVAHPDLVRKAKDKTGSIKFDMFLDTAHLSHFLEDHIHSVFPQFQQTDRPDAVAAALASGKIVWLMDNTPFALIAPVTFFDLFQSPEDYMHRWLVASFLRPLRFLAFLFAMVLTPIYVALTMHHYQSIPLEILYLLLESRSQIPFNPFWEALFMLLTLEILKEASLRMPTKAGQTLGIVGGIVIGQAAVSAKIASSILIIHVAITAISSFLIPNYIMTNSSKLIQFGLLVLAAWLGLWGIAFGIALVAVHLHGLTSLGIPYLSPLVPFHKQDWKDTVLRLPLRWMTRRPAYLHPLDRRRNT
ncbi:MAG: hypothetical protein BLM47_00555 [Candidatus Reconcilbacillus cellulovorans]|uniref:Spore germination protein n=1 Tax=Candidatus Reconcilbacillus cellulovorans TaxID=1906605 RepID=A0A2A6E4B5_9BACL|nr:MAG: hypothetical protein BLM47_00555 [Candidatus Reconcilbacillus cellulovorans]